MPEATENQNQQGKGEFDFDDEVVLDPNATILEEDNEPVEKGEETEGAEEGAGTEEEQEEQEEQEEEEQESETLIGSIQTTLGYEFKDESGNPKVYEDTEEGLIEYTKDIQKHLVDEAKKEAVNSLPPEVKDYYNHLALGKSKTEYFNNPLLDIQNVTLDNDIDLAKQIIKTRFVKSGFSNKEADDMILNLEATGEDALHKKAESDLAFLREIDTKEKTEREASIKAARDRQVLEAQEEWNNVVKIVKSRNLAGLQIPANEVESFLAYISNPVKEGKSQNVLDYESEGLDRSLAADYQRFKKYDLGALVKLKVGEAKVASLKDKFKANTKGGQENRQGGVSNSFDFNEL